MPRPTTIAKWLGLAYATGWIAFMISGADGWDVALFGLLFLPWQLGPVAAAALLVKASRSPVGAWTFVLVEVALVAWTAGLVADPLLSPERWTSVGGALTLAYISPFWQFIAVLGCLGVASLSGWRARDSWLRG